jgi:hypothetical protein
MVRRSGAAALALLAGVLLGVTLWSPAGVCGEDGVPKYALPEGVYIDLTKDFYEALKGEGLSGSRTYSNDLSEEYLKQIAVSTRFMVETNFEVLRQQERLMQLLLLILKERKP